MKILVFLHGTTIMHASAAGRSRDERVQQVRDRDASIDDFAAYVPVGKAVSRLQAWKRQGALIEYLSAQRCPEDVAIDRAVLRRHRFPAGQVFFRQDDEGYGGVVARARPDVLIEDDCESIGGENEMTYPHIEPALKAKIKWIVVKEFGGIDHLPDDLAALLND